MRVITCLIFCLVVVSLPPRSYATIKYWDTNNSTAGAGGATPNGTWDTMLTTNWSTSSLGNITTTSWSIGDTAVFAAGNDAIGAYTVTPSGTVNLAGLTVEEGTITQAGGKLDFGTTSNA